MGLFGLFKKNKNQNQSQSKNPENPEAVEYYKKAMQDNKNRIELLEKAVELGYGKAKPILGGDYVKRKTSTQEQLEKAAAWCEEAAHYLDAGKAYEKLKQYKKAMECYINAANFSGSGEAQTYVGIAYEKGTWVEQDYATAARYYQKAADKGFYNASYRLGMLYLNGNGVVQDYNKAINLLVAGGPEGCAEAAGMYLAGKFVKKDTAKAFQYANKWSHKSDQCRYLLAYMYYNGIGTKKNEEEALWYAARLYHYEPAKAFVQKITQQKIDELQKHCLEGKDRGAIVSDAILGLHNLVDSGHKQVQPIWKSCIQARIDEAKALFAREDSPSQTLKNIKTALFYLEDLRKKGSKYVDTYIDIENYQHRYAYEKVWDAKKQLEKDQKTVAERLYQKGLESDDMEFFLVAAQMQHPAACRTVSLHSAAVLLRDLLSGNTTNFTLEQARQQAEYLTCMNQNNLRLEEAVEEFLLEQIEKCLHQNKEKNISNSQKIEILATLSWAKRPLCGFMMASAYFYTGEEEEAKKLFEEILHWPQIEEEKYSNLRYLVEKNVRIIEQNIKNQEDYQKAKRAYEAALDSYVDALEEQEEKQKNLASSSTGSSSVFLETYKVVAEAAEIERRIKGHSSSKDWWD